MNSGALTVKAGKPTTLWRRVDFGKRNKGQTIPAGSPVTLRKGDQLVVTELTPVTLTNDGPRPAEMIGAVIFHVRPGFASQSSWVDGPRTTDPFQGIPRWVAGGGLGYTFPKGEAHIILDLSETKPGARFPRHLHPGPELITDTAGSSRSSRRPRW